MNIKNAKKKLREARFFLSHMIEQERMAGDEEPFNFYLIPVPIDQNPCAHWRSPMDMMRQG